MAVASLGRGMIDSCGKALSGGGERVRMYVYLVIWYPVGRGTCWAQVLHLV